MINQQQKKIPARYQETNSTDILWLIVGLVFIVAMMIISYIMFNAQTLSMINFPVNSFGQICAIKYANTYPYLYIFNEQERVCISSCQKNYERYQCQQQSVCQKYQQQMVTEIHEINTKLGGVCVSENQLKIIFKIPQISKKINFIKMYYVALWSIAISLTIGAIYLIFLRLFGSSFLKFIFYISLMLLLGTTIVGVYCILQYRYNLSYLDFILLVIITSVSIILFLVLILIQIFNKDKNLVCLALFQHVTKDIKISFAWIIFEPLIFSIINVLIIVMMITQYLFFASSSNPKLTEGSFYYQLTTLNIGSILTIGQGIWLTKLLYQIHQYVVSGVIVNYTFLNDQNSLFSKLFCRNLGSVFKSSIINFFFGVPFSLLTWIKPNENGANLTKGCFCICGYLLNKSQLYKYMPYPYMVALGSDYQKCSFSTQYLFHIYYKSRESSSAQHYDISGKVFVVLTSLIGIFLIQWKIYEFIQITHIIASAFLMYTLCMYSIGFYYIATSSSQICYFIDQEIEGKNMPQKVKKDIEQYLINDKI